MTAIQAADHRSYLVVADRHAVVYQVANSDNQPITSLDHLLLLLLHLHNLLLHLLGLLHQLIGIAASLHAIAHSACDAVAMRPAQGCWPAHADAGTLPS